MSVFRGRVWCYSFDLPYICSIARPGGPRLSSQAPSLLTCKSRFPRRPGGPPRHFSHGPLLLYGIVRHLFKCVLFATFRNVPHLLWFSAIYLFYSHPHSPLPPRNLSKRVPHHALHRLPRPQFAYKPVVHTQYRHTCGHTLLQHYPRYIRFYVH